jgi:hypothetical protein
MDRTLRERLGEPTEDKTDCYIGRDGCKGKEIH